MTIGKIQNGSALTLELDGRLDTNTAPLLDKELNTSLDGIKDLTFDFAKLEYVSSAGLRELIIAYKIMHEQGHMRVINANEIVKEVFEVTGVSNIISVN